MASGQPTLDDCIINLKSWREQHVEELTELIKRADGTEKNKLLVLDPEIAGPLGLIVDAKVLKGLGIDKIINLEPEKYYSEYKNVIYMVQPKIKYMKWIEYHINSHIAANNKRKYFVFFMPRRTMVCERALGTVWDDITFGEYSLDLLPFDSDLLSMELSSGLKDLSLEGDITILNQVAKSLVKFQTAFGKIPNILGKGTNALATIKIMKNEMASIEDQLVIPDIDTLIIIDREVDLITPLCTQLTFEGFIDEVFGIFNATVNLPAEMLITDPKKEKEQATPGSRKLIALNSNDKPFRDTRDINIGAVGAKLNLKAKQIKEYYNARHTLREMETSELKDYASKLGSYRKEEESLARLINITKALVDVNISRNFRSTLDIEHSILAQQDPAKSLAFIEECIDKQDPIEKVIRLLCLFSLTNNGIREKEFNHLRREILQTYGYKYLFALENLGKIGMFRMNVPNKANLYPRIIKDLDLIKENINDQDPNDIAYVYSGYAPISVRLVEKAISVPPPSEEQKPILKSFLGQSNSKESDISSGWGNSTIDNIISLSGGGPAFRTKQALPKGLPYTAGEKKSKVVLVFFLGGCTYTEVSAVRFLRQKSEAHEFLIATTKLINGNTLTQSFIEKLGKEPAN